MTASYPSAIKTTFTTHVNVTEIIDAGHPNSIQDEVVAIESTIGTSPATTAFPSSGFSSAAANSGITTVVGRLNNIEAGVIGDAHTQYLRKAADSSNNIIPSAGTNVGLTIQGNASGQSANLQEWRTSGGTLVAYVDPNGVLGGTSNTNSANAGIQDLLLFMGA